MSSFVKIKKPYRKYNNRFKGAKSKIYTIRLRDNEFEVITKASKKLDTKFSTFIKYFAIEASKQINED